jgi:hypothetical protein
MGTLFLLMFISFAPPKEMNQRKRVRKSQPVPLAALRVGTGSHLFRFVHAPFSMKCYFFDRYWFNSLAVDK